MKYVTPVIETDRLILKRGKYKDFCKVYEYNMTRLRNINDEFEFVKTDPETLRDYENAADDDYTIDFVMFLKDSNTPIGNVVFDRYRSEYNSLEIAYNTHPDYWKKGYTYEAALNAMHYIFTNLDIDNIICGYEEGNFKSANLGKKIGFKYLDSYYFYHKRYGKDIKSTETIISKNDFLTKFSDDPVINYKVLDNTEKN